ETAYAITTIFAFNILALLCLPLIGHAVGIGQPTFGTWVGTAVNDTSVVVATGYTYGPIAGGIATLVKLTRTILLVPLCIAVGLGCDVEGSRSLGLRPFLIGFALATTMAVISIGLIVLLGLAQ